MGVDLSIGVVGVFFAREARGGLDARPEEVDEGGLGRGGTNAGVTGEEGLEVGGEGEGEDLSAGEVPKGRRATR